MSAIGVKVILNEFFKMKALCGLKSATGSQLDALRNNLVGGTPSYNPDAAENRQIKFAVLVKIWDALNDTEQRVMEARDLPKGSQEYTKTVRKCMLKNLYVPLYDQGGECNAETKAGDKCRNHRMPGDARCGIHKAQQTKPITQITDDAEEYVSESEHEGFAVVRGVKAMYNSHEDIAKLLGLTTYIIRRHISSANNKIEAHSLYGLAYSMCHR